MTDTCVRRVPVFAGLAAPDQQRVARLARPTHLGAGDVAYSAGDEARLMVVHTGHLRIWRPTLAGSERLIRVLGPGEFTGESAVLSGRRTDDRATAVDDCELCVFRHGDLAALIREHPEIGLRMLAAVTERLAETEHRLGALTSGSVERRLAEYLFALPGTWRGDRATVTLPLAKKDVASLLDTTPESLSRALRSLADQGVIAIGAGRSVSITQPDRLREIVDEQ